MKNLDNAYYVGNKIFNSGTNEENFSEAVKHGAPKQFPIGSARFGDMKVFDTFYSGGMKYLKRTGKIADSWVNGQNVACTFDENYVVNIKP